MQLTRRFERNYKKVINGNIKSHYVNYEYLIIFIKK